MLERSDMMKYFYGKQIVLADRVLENGFIGVENGIIVDISSTEPKDTQVEVMDYGEYVISAGLVDTHIHGYGQADVMDNQLSAIQTISNGILEMGVTSWLATTLTSSTKHLNEVCQTLGHYHTRLTGAKMQGVFLEGPYFTETYKGAQNAKYMSDPSIEQLHIWQELSNGMIKKIAIAPERQGVEEFIKAAKKMGIYVALGHSDASFDQAEDAIKQGASIFVHIFNGMRGLHHREPGMVGAALSSEKVYVELIADGYHVHPMAARLVTRARGPQETVLITDCMRAGGIGDGESYLGELPVIVKDGQARLVNGGNLAGSVLKLIDAVKNMVDWQNVSLVDSLRMASIIPAKSVGIENQCGQIKEGMPADFIVITKNAELKATYLDGECRYQE